MLKTRNLHFTYDSAQQFDFPDMTCQKGEQWLIIGQSGCGKTTLLHLMAGLLRPKSGEVTLGDTDLSTLSESKLDTFRGKNVGIIFQQSHLIRALSVEENLLTAQFLAGSRQDRKKVASILARLNMSHKLKSNVQNLSIGEQQRVAIGRALVNDPLLILADEPTSSLDDVNCKEVVNLLMEQSEYSNATLVIVTHDGRLKDMIENRIELSSQQEKSV